MGLSAIERNRFRKEAEERLKNTIVSIARDVSVNSLWLHEILQDLDALNKYVTDFHCKSKKDS
jgi:hypothetical protein